MKERIMQVVSAIIALCLLLCGCSSNSDYKYASKWKSRFDITLEDAAPLDLTEDKELEVLLEECKELILATNLKEKYSYFCWDKFDTVDIKRSKGLYVKTTEQVVKEGVDAKYSIKLNTIAVLPVCDVYSEEYFKTIIVHELMHTLTSSKEAYLSPLWEGVADKFAAEVCMLHNLPFEFQYMYEVYFLKLLDNCFGEEKTMQMIWDGTLEQKIEELTEEGFGKKFSDALFVIQNYVQLYGTDTTELENLLDVELDIIVHMTRNHSDTLGEDERAEMLSNCKKMLIKENKYFEELLK